MIRKGPGMYDPPPPREPRDYGTDEDGEPLSREDWLNNKADHDYERDRDRDL